MRSMSEAWKLGSEEVESPHASVILGDADNREIRPTDGPTRDDA